MTIDGKIADSVDVLKTNPTSTPLGVLGAIDLASGGIPITNVILNPNSPLSYPLETTEGNMLKVRTAPLRNIILFQNQPSKLSSQLQEIRSEKRF